MLFRSKCQKELDDLKKKLEENAASVEKTKDAAALKKLKKEEKDTNEKIAQVNKKYAGLAGKVQDAYKKRKEGIQSTKLRLSRKVKGGQALSEEELKKAGISPAMVRFSIGIEDEQDLLSDLAQAFDCI